MTDNTTEEDLVDILIAQLMKLKIERTVPPRTDSLIMDDEIYNKINIPLASSLTKNSKGKILIPDDQHEIVYCAIDLCNRIKNYAKRNIQQRFHNILRELNDYARKRRCRINISISGNKLKIRAGRSYSIVTSFLYDENTDNFSLVYYSCNNCKNFREDPFISSKVIGPFRDAEIIEVCKHSTEDHATWLRHKYNLSNEYVRSNLI